jgi:hypothetical protein
MQGRAKRWKIIQKSIVALNDFGATGPELAFGRSS